jgi:hypothetical protein
MQQLKGSSITGPGKFVSNIATHLAVVILLSLSRGITIAQAKLQPQLMGMMLSVQNLPSNDRVSSSGLNLTLIYPKEMIVAFCKEAQASEAFTRKSQQPLGQRLQHRRHQRPEAGGHVPHGSSHVAVPQWSFKKQSCDVID